MRVKAIAGNEKVTAVIGLEEGPASTVVWATPSDEGLSIDSAFADASLQACVADYASGKGWTFTHEITGYLDCSSRSIVDLHSMDQLVELTQLNLTNNAIVDTAPLTTLTDLTRLYLSNNQIACLNGLADLLSLNFLNLGGNRVINVDALGGLNALKELYLNNNQIVDAASLAGLVNLQSLDLRDNLLGGDNVGNIDDLVSLVNADSILLVGNNIGADSSDIDCMGVPAVPINILAGSGN